MSKTKTVPMGSYKYDRRFNDNVLRGNYSRNKTKSVLNRPSRGKQTGKNIGVVVCIALFCFTWYICWSNNKVVSTAEASGTCPVDFTMLDKKGFESADMPKQDVTVEDKIKTAFPKDWNIMLAIAHAESNLDPLAYNDSTKYPCVGVFQIRLLPERGITRTQMEDVDHNIEYAKMLHDKYGFKPWSAWLNGSFKKFLN